MPDAMFNAQPHATPHPAATYGKGPATSDALEQLQRSRQRLHEALEQPANTHHTPPGLGAARLLLQTALTPWAQRKPWQLVASASAVGALLVWSRPWRWLDRSTLARTALTQVLLRWVP